ncbi:MAG: MFS transporter [Elusimicrobiota bacterium]|jgi:fucose permease|nr:MFS transporter [Elusimicrobiota bacterium]
MDVKTVDVDKNYQKVSQAMYLLMFAFSISSILLQVLMTNIIKTFSLTGSAQALLPSMFICGGMASVILLPFMKGRITKAFVMSFSSCFMGVMIFLLAFPASISWASALCFALGIFAGWIDSYCNSTIIDTHKTNNRKYVGYLHASFCLGAITMPFVIQFFMSYLHLNWREVCFISALMIIAISFVFIITAHKNKERINADSYEKKLTVAEIKNFMRDKFYVVMVLCYAFFCLSQNGISIWLFHYTKTVHPSIEILPSLILSCFWFGGFLSRLFYYKIKMNAMKLFIVGITISITAYTIGILHGDPLILFIMIFIMSLTSGFGFPTLVNETLTHYRGNTTMAVTGLHFFGKLGAFIMPLIMGSVAAFNIQFAMLINNIAAVIALFAAAAVLFMEKKKWKLNR